MKANVMKRSERRRRYLRVSAYFLFLGVLASFASIRNARAEVAAQALELGRQMHHIAGSGATSEATRVLINGQPVIVGSSVSEDSAKAVLDRYEAHCRKNLAQSSESWREALSAKDEDSSDDKSDASYFDTGVMRTGGDDGMVVCFNRTSESKATVKEALEAFGTTGNLNAFGALRYVYAKPTTSGRGAHVLTVWTEEKFDFTKLMFEEGKDVAGEDFAEIPREANSMRVLSARVDGAPYGVNVYVVPGVTPEESAKFHDEAMEARGWLKLNPGQQEALGGVGRAYEQDGVVLTLFSFTDSNKTFTTLGLSGVPARDALLTR